MTIQEMLSEARVEYLESGHQHSRSGWLQIKTCPFCGSGNYHLGYNLEHGYFSCWRCGFHNRYSVLTSLNVPRHLFNQLPKNPQASHHISPVRRGLKEPDFLMPLNHEESYRHQVYLRNRGFDHVQLAKEWKLEAIGIAARLAWRIYIPIYHQGLQVSWTTRAIGEEVEQRYISASAAEEAINHKHVVFGLDHVRDTVLICEGPFDAMKMGIGAVALFGLAYSASQVRLLSRIPNRYVCLDNSVEAQAVARKLAGELSCFPGNTHILEIDARDPGEASREEVRTVRQTIGLV